MLDLIQLCRDHGVPLIEEGHHHTHQGWVQIHCPLCTGGRGGWHMGFSLEKGNFNCWLCGSHRALEVITAMLRSESAARRAMGKYQTDVHRKPPIQKARPREVKRPPGMKGMGRNHRNYLRSRHFRPDQLADTWDIEGTKYLSGEWNWRLVFPIYDSQGVAQAYCGRSIDPDIKPKYKMTNNADMRVDPCKLLYGIHLVQDTVIVVEGPTDVWRLGPGAVATLGIDWKPEQAHILAGIPRRIIMFDPDDKAQRQAAKLAERLSMFRGSTELISDIPCDPGNMSQRYANELLDKLQFPRPNTGD